MLLPARLPGSGVTFVSSCRWWGSCVCTWWIRFFSTCAAAWCLVGHSHAARVLQLCRWFYMGANTINKEAPPPSPSHLRSALQECRSKLNFINCRPLVFPRTQSAGLLCRRQTFSRRLVVGFEVRRPVGRACSTKSLSGHALGADFYVSPGQRRRHWQISFVFVIRVARFFLMPFFICVAGKWRERMRFLFFCRRVSVTAAGGVLLLFEMRSWKAGRSDSRILIAKKSWRRRECCVSGLFVYIEKLICQSACYQLQS